MPPQKTAGSKSPTKLLPRTPRPGAAPDSRKNILILTLGTSPAVLTETIWALAHPRAGVAAVIPDTIEILTTQKGREVLEREVLVPGVWKKLRDQIATGPHSKRLVLKDCLLIETADLESGTTRKKTDVRSSEDTSHTADSMLRLVKSHSGARIIASISGGRKSMSALLYGVMSVAGKRGDRIVHVVSDPLLGEFPPRDFFFPGQGGTITLKDRGGQPAGRPLLCSDLRSELADLPFVPLGDKFAELRETHADFATLVGSITGELAGGLTPVVIGESSLKVGSVEVHYTDIDYASEPRMHTRAILRSLLVNRGFENHLPKRANRGSEGDRIALALEQELGFSTKGNNWLSKLLSGLRGKLRAGKIDDEKITALLPDMKSKSAKAHPNSAVCMFNPDISLFAIAG